MFTSATSHERIQILHNLSTAALRPAVRLDPRGAEQAVATLEQAAMAADAKQFALVLADVLILPVSIAENVRQRCAGRAIGLRHVNHRHAG